MNSVIACSQCMALLQPWRQPRQATHIALIGKEGQHGTRPLAPVRRTFSRRMLKGGVSGRLAAPVPPENPGTHPSEGPPPSLRNSWTPIKKACRCRQAFKLHLDAASTASSRAAPPVNRRTSAYQMANCSRFSFWIHLGALPRPVQVCPVAGLRYLGATFVPLVEAAREDERPAGKTS